MNVATYHTILWVMLGTLSATLVGCDSTELPVETTRRPAPRASTPSPWQIANGSAQVAVAQEADDPELAQAITEARNTVDQARERWLNSTVESRSQWTVKWAAPNVAGGVEHVWIKPILYWSTFRIEGLLASPPQTELASGKGFGEPVSFPVQELSDWVYLIDGRIDGEHEGGFTVKLLEQRYGQPD